MEPENQPQEKEIVWNHHFLGFHATLCGSDTDPRKDSESFYLVEPHIPRLLAVHVALQGQISAVTVGETQEAVRWKPLDRLAYIGDEKIPSNIGITISPYKDPH